MGLTAREIEIVSRAAREPSKHRANYFIRTPELCLTVV